MIILYVVLLVFPALGAALGWLLLHRLSRPLAWAIGLLAGIAPAALFAGAIYRGEGGGGDPDPLLFLQMSVGASALVALATLAGLHRAARRSE